MWLQGTNDITKDLNQFYLDNYKMIFNEYNAELEFTTILTYYSGSCALVLDIHSTKEANTYTDMCIMLECSENDLKNLSKEILIDLFENKILNRYKGLLELNSALCKKRINRKVIIRNTNFNEGILNIKLDNETIQIELNYNKITDINKQSMDFINSLESLSKHFIEIS